jgi:hypothetical protein
MTFGHALRRSSTDTAGFARIPQAVLELAIAVGRGCGDHVSAAWSIEISGDLGEGCINFELEPT